MAYPTDIAATLSGATPRQLAYWRRPKNGEVLLRPELRESGGRLLYSFRDVMALRTFVFLREQLPLQRIRKAVSSLRDLGNTDHLSRYELVVAGDSVVWRSPDDTFTDLVEHPGAGRIAAVMREVWGPFTNLQGAEVVDLLRPRPHIAVDPEVQGGYPVIKGTRIEFDLVASLVADGVSPERIKDFYPSVSADAALDAVSFEAVVERYRSGNLAAAS